MRINYQGHEEETAAATLGALVRSKFPGRGGVVVECDGKAYGPGDDIDSVPLAEGAAVNAFRIVSGG